MKISVIIHTLNAEQFLDRVLCSVKDYNEIIICDMYSTDSTIEIANKYNCKIVYHDNVGFADPARTFAISQASNDWVLVVDADELIPQDLQQYLIEQVKLNPNLGGIRIPRKNYLLGKFMHSAYPDYILRFLRKEGAVWPVTVHSQPVVNGIIIDIPKNRMDLAFIHLSNEPISVVIKKMNTYTSFEVERRKNKNYGVVSLLTEPFVRFLRFYIFKGGFRDGLPGFIWACMYAYYKFITIAKIIEAKITKNNYDKDLI